MPVRAVEDHRSAMKPGDLVTLTIEAEAYDAVVVLWRTRRGTQPVLMPRSLGRGGASAAGPDRATVEPRRPDRSGPSSRSGRPVRPADRCDRQAAQPDLLTRRGRA